MNKKIGSGPVFLPQGWSLRYRLLAFLVRARKACLPTQRPRAESANDNVNDRLGPQLSRRFLRSPFMVRAAFVHLPVK